MNISSFRNLGASWVRIPENATLTLACCDCGLVHHVKTRVAEDGSVEQFFKRKNRLTKLYRKQLRKQRRHKEQS